MLLMDVEQELFMMLLIHSEPILLVGTEILD